MRIKARPQRLLPAEAPIVPFRPEPTALERLLARHEAERAVALEKRRRERAETRAESDEMRQRHDAQKHEAAAWKDEDPTKYARLMDRLGQEWKKMRWRVWDMERRHNTTSSNESRKRRREVEELEEELGQT